MNRIVITGGAGFIESHVADRIMMEYPEAQLLILDKMTYAADYDNIVHLLNDSSRKLFVGDLCNQEFCLRFTRGVDLVLHLAAESHVDNSFGNSLMFTQSNTLGTHALLEACRVNEVKKFIHVSTDEVYGEIHDGFHVETDFLNPTNPYSASKAAADMIVNSYVQSFKMPIISVRANNIYGIRQYPEKLIPRCTVLGLSGRKFVLHGTGKNSRRYLAAADFADALILLIKKGKDGQIYNVGSDVEYTNLEIAGMIAERLGKPLEEMTMFVADRPFNDSRYAIDSSKIHALGWKPQRPLESHLSEVMQWYKDHLQRYANGSEALFHGSQAHRPTPFES
jgi:UDP-glucose 4,6-dehydratase